MMGGVKLFVRTFFGASIIFGLGGVLGWGLAWLLDTAGPLKAGSAIIIIIAATAATIRVLVERPTTPGDAP